MGLPRGVYPPQGGTEKSALMQGARNDSPRATAVINARRYDEAIYSIRHFAKASA
jgi:hypothetical protein